MLNLICYHTTAHTFLLNKEISLPSLLYSSEIISFREIDLRFDDISPLTRARSEQVDRVPPTEPFLVNILLNYRFEWGRWLFVFISRICEGAKPPSNIKKVICSRGGLGLCPNNLLVKK